MAHRSWELAHPEKVKEYKRQWVIRNADKVRNYQKAYNKEHPEKLAARKRAYRKRHPDKVREEKRNYRKRNLERLRPRRTAAARNLRRKQPEISLAKERKHRGLPEPTRPEPNLCECCGEPPNCHGTICLDHCHITGAFRGWLCHSCNSGIGMLGDNLAGVLRAEKYLRMVRRKHGVVV